MIVSWAARSGCALALVGVCNAASTARAQSEADLRRAWETRRAEIDRALASAPARYVLTAGDSHADGLGNSRSGCAPLVNGGIGGIDLARYADLSETLTFPTKPAAIVLTVGTNNLLARRKPRSTAARIAFTRASIRLLTHLSANTERLIVTAIPPFAERVAGKLDEGAHALYTSEMRNICDSVPNCTFADPYAGVRTGRFAVAKSDALEDALHLRDHAAIWRELDPLVCGSP